MRVGEVEAGVDRSGRRAPVLVELEAGNPSGQRLVHALGRGGVALAREADVHREAVGGLQHHLDLLGRRSACGRARAARGAGAAAVECRDPRGEGLGQQLRADVVHVRVDAARRDDHLLARDRLCRHARHHACSTHARWQRGHTGLQPRAHGAAAWPHGVAGTVPGVTPSMTSGLPALPMPTIMPPLMPMSALTTPSAASMMSAFMMT
eukprot:scaffold119369_cov60-Phaeocystis_antarctica.AAC.2